MLRRGRPREALRALLCRVWSRMSCCVAGNQSLAAPEGDLLETLQLLSDRAGLPLPAAATTADGVRPLTFYRGPRGIFHRISCMCGAAPIRDHSH